MQSWYDKYGSSIGLWAENVQVEFSRRYEGATLRAATAADLTREQAQSIAKAAAAADYAAQGLADIEPLCYPMLFSERAFDDGVARYLVICCPDRPADASAEALKTAPDVLVLMNAQTGEVESVKHELDERDRAMIKGVIK